MPRLDSPETQFEEFVVDLFKRFGMVVIEYTPWDKHHNYDLKVRTPQNTYAIVEVRLYRTLHIDITNVYRTVDILVQIMAKVGTNIGIWVTNSRIPAHLKQEAKALGVVIYDFDVLTKLVEFQADLSEQWERLSQEGFIYRSEVLPPPVPITTIDLITLPETVSTLEQAIREAKGNRLCNDLCSLKAGQGKPAIRFEELCVESLQYLFSNDFINWTPQRISHANLHRFDLIARISSQNDFWNSIITDHRARYVIFEFKNYGKQLTQAEIYSTEKYLLPLAMRSTAIVISRLGVNRNAYRVMTGALREAGKVIISINLNQLCDMLHRKDRGEDPSEVIAEELEALLTGLER